MHNSFSPFISIVSITKKLPDCPQHNGQMWLCTGTRTKCRHNPFGYDSRTSIVTRDTMLELKTWTSKCDGEVEARHEPGEELRHVGIPVHLSNPMACQSGVKPQYVNLPARGVSPCLPEGCQHSEPELPRFFGWNILCGWKKELEISDSCWHWSISWT